MKSETIEFKSKELSEYQDKIEIESSAIIKALIKEHCPIAVGEKVKTFPYLAEAEWLMVTKISLLAVDSWGCLGEELSFSYKGAPLTKNGELMKNRKTVWFGTFEKNGKRYNTPSYLRRPVLVASMNHKNRL